MIRRNPTLIPMTDMDVQDVRDMVAKQKAGLQSHQQLMVKMKRLADNPSMSKEDMEMFEQMKEAMARSEKAKRLGLEPGQFPTSHSFGDMFNGNRIIEILITLQISILYRSRRKNRVRQNADTTEQ